MSVSKEEITLLKEVSELKGIQPASEFYQLPFELMERIKKVLTQPPYNTGKGGVFVKVSERQPSSAKVDTYHVNVKYLDMDDSVLMPSVCTYSGEWETNENEEVVEWLDETSSPISVGAKTEQGIEAVELLDWAGNNGFIWSPSEEKWCKWENTGYSSKTIVKRTSAELYNLYKSLIKL